MSGPRPEVRRLAPGEYQVAHLPGNEDASIRRQGRRWIVDIFSSSIDDADEAWLAAEVYATLRTALAALGVE